MKFLKTYSAITILTLLGFQYGRAQEWTKPYSSPTATGNCAGLSSGLSSEFAVTPLISRAIFPIVNPLRIDKMAFWMNPTSGQADIYLSEKGGGGVAGRVLYYDGTAKTLTAIGTIPNVYTGFNEQGVIGIALSPKTFATDNFLYFMYSVGSLANPSATNGFRISRFKVNLTTKVLDITSEKILIHIPAGTANRWHTAGSMQFDNYGNLYINIGDNESEANGPANTADLRGGILRIHPDASTAKGYTIPAGNFGDYWAQQWQKQGLVGRATAYRDTSIVKPEIYVKGSRNAYGSGTDKNRLGWIAWSECGPDVAGQRAEEYNITNHPAFSGWPFWVGFSVKQLAFANGYDEQNEPKTDSLWALFNPASNLPAVPVNNWPSAKGYDTLPPMHQPTYTLPAGCAQGGTIIRYDGSINNPGKMPPQLDNTVMYTELGDRIFAVKFDTLTGANVGTVATVFGGLSVDKAAPNLGNSLDFQQGPDGALYSVNWGEGCCNGDRGGVPSEGIARITYKGTCQDPGLIPVAVEKQPIRSDVDWLRMGANSFSVTTYGPHEIQIMNAQGRVLTSLKGEGKMDYKIPATLPKASVYFLQVKTNLGTAIRGFLNP